MTKLFAIALPILEGKKDQLRKFTDDLQTHYRTEFNESRKDLGVRERTFLQSTPKGDMVIVTLEGKNPSDALKKLAEKNDEFTKWFSSQVKEIHGIDISQKNATLPTVELIAETEPIKEHAL